MAQPIPPIEETVALPHPPERAYAVFKDEFGVRWPADYTYSGLWQIADDRTPRPDPAASSQVEVVFEPDPGGSIVRLTHSGFERYGDGRARYRAEMAAEYGWPLIMAKFADYAGAR